MSQIRPILGHLNFWKIAPEVERCAQGPVWDTRTDENKPNVIRDE